MNDHELDLKKVNTDFQPASIGKSIMWSNLSSGVTHSYNNAMQWLLQLDNTDGGYLFVTLILLAVLALGGWKFHLHI